MQAYYSNLDNEHHIRAFEESLQFIVSGQFSACEIEMIIPILSCQAA